jgi:peroxiredoxin
MKRILFILSVCLLAVTSKAFAQKLPQITLKDINGKAISVDTLSNGGKPFIIDFFATWCKPCNRELDAIAEVYEEWQEETGVKLFAVSIDRAQNTNKVKPLVDNHGWTYDVLLDPNSELRRTFGGELIPYVVICDGEGNVVYKHNGYTDGAENELIEKVRELVAKDGDKDKDKKKE